MKKKYILGIVLIAAIIFGIILLIVQCSSDKDFVKNVTLSENGVTREELEFSAANLKPGDSRDYILNLKCKTDGKYAIGLAFSEEKDGGLRNYVTVTITYEDFSVAYTLDELFKGRIVELDCNISSDPAQIHVIFTMPSEVGNEAQGAETDFIVILTAER